MAIYLAGRLGAAERNEGAFAINDRGTVVGATLDSSGRLRAFSAGESSRPSIRRRNQAAEETDMATEASAIGMVVALTAAALLSSGGGASPRARIDHIILGVGDLEHGIESFAQLTGVRPSYGGKHPTGTHNALVALGDGVYLEILALQPGVTATGDAAGLAGLSSLTPVGWAVSPLDATQTRHHLAAAGLALSEPQPGSRLTPAGTRLAWSTFGLQEPVAEAPFFIAWSPETIHPAATSPSGCSLLEWQVAGPHHATLQRLVDALGLAVEVVAASGPSFQLALTCPKGVARFSSPPPQQ